MSADGPAEIEITHHRGWSELTLNRPAQRNALSTSLLLQLESGVQQSEQRGATVIVLSAAGPVFCAGVDIKERRGPDYSQGTSAPFVQALLSTSVYLVARVEAPVLGAGLALLAVCPTVIATSDVWAALPESRRGKFPVAVAPYLEHLIPRRELLELGITGRQIPSDELHRYGLISRIVAGDDIDAAVAECVADRTASPVPTRLAASFWRSQYLSETFSARYATAVSSLATSEKGANS